MTILFIFLIAGFLYIFLKYGVNRYSIGGGIIGLILGSSLGVAGGGTAVSGIFIFGGVGFIIGGLLKPRKSIDQTQINRQTTQTVSKSKSEFRSIPKNSNGKINFDQLLEKKMHQQLSSLIFDLENMGDTSNADYYLGRVKGYDFNLYLQVLENLKKMRLNHFMK